MSLRTLEDMPVEIISQVFILGLPSYSGTRANLLGIRQHQILLGSVCARWRDISHATPALWATHLMIGQFNKDNVEAIDGEDPSITALAKQEFAEKMLSLCVDRSGSTVLSVSAIYRPLILSLSGTQRDPEWGASELSTKSMSLLGGILPRIHDLYMDLPRPSPVINTFFPIINAPRLRRFHFRHHEVDSPLFTEESTVPLEELGLDLFFPLRITLPSHLVKHLRHLDLVSGVGVRPHIFEPHTAQPSISGSHDSMVTTAEAALSEYQQLEHVRLSGAHQTFLEIHWPSSVKTLHIRVEMFEPAGFHPTISANLVHLSIVFDGFQGNPLDEPAQWSSKLGLPALVSLRTLSLRQGIWANHGTNIDTKNWLLLRAPNLQVLETDESFAKHIVDSCADLEFTFAPSESWFSSLLLWRIIFQLRGAEVFPSFTQDRPRRIMAQNRIVYWRRFSKRYEERGGPKIQWGVDSGQSDPDFWFGPELPEACCDLAATLPSVSRQDIQPSLEELHETLCRSS